MSEQWAIEVTAPDGIFTISDTYRPTESESWSAFYSGRRLIHPMATVRAIKVEPPLLFGEAACAADKRTP